MTGMSGIDRNVYSDHRINSPGFQINSIRVEPARDLNIKAHNSFKGSFNKMEIPTKNIGAINKLQKIKQNNLRGSSGVFGTGKQSVESLNGPK